MWTRRRAESEKQSRKPMKQKKKVLEVLEEVDEEKVLEGLEVVDEEEEIKGSKSPVSD